MEIVRREESKERKVTGLRNEGRVRSGSTSGVLEMWKRKRDVEVEGEGEEGKDVVEKGEIFQKSKKTARSPERGVEGREVEMMGEMKKWMEEMMGRWERMEERMEEKMKLIMGELEGMKRREGEWRREREKMERRVGDLEKKLEGLKLEEEGKGIRELEQRVGKLEKDGRGGGVEGGGNRELEEKVRRMEERWEGKDRKERRRRVVIKGYKTGDKDVRGKIEEILKRVGAEVEIEEVREVKTGREEQGGFAIVSFRTEGEKREVMRKKGGLRGERIWIEDDLTWRERQVRWKVREMAKEEERKGARVWVGENKMRINGVWWFWDEEEGGLRDGEGRKWGERERVREKSGEGERKG